jgi:hypothetical protein
MINSEVLSPNEELLIRFVVRHSSFVIFPRSC